MDEERRTTEVHTTDTATDAGATSRQTVTERSSVPSSVVAQRIVWYVIGVIVAFLALRLLLQILGAQQGNAFVDFVYSVSAVFAAPFFGMFSYEPSYGVSSFEVSTLVAIVIYLLAGWAIAQLFTIGSRRRDV